MTRNRQARRDNLLKRHRVRRGAEPVRISIGPLPEPVHEHAGQDGEPEVTPVTGPDGEVRCIVVRCACGREIRIDCQYSEEE
jgi:hypothetical protein